MDSQYTLDVQKKQNGIPCNVFLLDRTEFHWLFYRKYVKIYFDHMIVVCIMVWCCQHLCLDGAVTVSIHVHHGAVSILVIDGAVTVRIHVHHGAVSILLLMVLSLSASMSTIVLSAFVS